MAQVSFKVSARDLKNAINKRVVKPLISLQKNQQVMAQIANKALEIVEPYVPMKTGDLRKSGHVVQHARYTMITWGKPGIGRTMYYARYQHNADDSKWRRTTPGTMSQWTRKIAPGSMGYRKLVAYARPIVRKAVKNGGR